MMEDSPSRRSFGRLSVRTPQKSTDRDHNPSSKGSRAKGSSCSPSLSTLQKEQRSQLEALRLELEAERLRSKEAQRRFAVRARELRVAAKRDQQQLEDKLYCKWEQQWARKLQQLREELEKKHKAKICQVLHQKEAKLHEAQQLMRRERDAALRQARDLHSQLARDPYTKKKAKTLNVLKKDAGAQTLPFRNEATENKKHTVKTDPRNEEGLQALRKQLLQQQEQCGNLKHDLEENQKRCEEVERELHQVSSENARLYEENSQLRERIKWAEKMENENKDLRMKLRQATEERDSALQVTQGLEIKVENLEHRLKDMEERPGSPRDLPSGHKTTFPERQAKEGEIRQLQIQSDHQRPFRLRCFLARHSYDPFNGPNENPEAELPLTAGHCVYVYGEMGEDGFYVGELMDGRRGFVPSNLVEDVAGDHLFQLIPSEPIDISHNLNIPSDLQKLPGTSESQSLATGLTGEEFSPSEGGEGTAKRRLEVCLTPKVIFTIHPDSRAMSADYSSVESSLENWDTNSLSSESSLDSDLKKDHDVDTPITLAQNRFSEKNLGKQLEHLCHKLAKLRVSPVQYQRENTLRTGSWLDCIGYYTHIPLPSDLEEDSEEISLEDCSEIPLPPETEDEEEEVQESD